MFLNHEFNLEQKNNYFDKNIMKEKGLNSGTKWAREGIKVVNNLVQILQFNITGI